MFLGPPFKSSLTHHFPKNSSSNIHGAQWQKWTKWCFKHEFLQNWCVAAGRQSRRHQCQLSHQTAAHKCRTCSPWRVSCLPYSPAALLSSSRPIHTQTPSGSRRLLWVHSPAGLIVDFRWTYHTKKVGSTTTGTGWIKCDERIKNKKMASHLWLRPQFFTFYLFLQTDSLFNSRDD